MATMSSYRQGVPSAAKGRVPGPVSRNRAPDKVGEFSGRVGLSFDDGPYSTQLPEIIEILRRHGTPATFFMLGNRVRNYRASDGYDIASLHAAPDIIVANHGWDHSNLAKASLAALRSQVR